MDTTPVVGLPDPQSRLFGRDEEIFEVRRLLEDGARLVTVTGAGGVGKTRVALEVCRKVSGQVAFVGLADTDAGGLAGALVRVLAPGTADADPARTIARALVGEPWVVVLDTFEHLAASAGLLADLLHAGPDLQLLVTSRTRLRLDGEQVVALGALPPGADGAAVRLFCDRARAVGAAAQSCSGDELVAIDQVCTLLDGTPLAIELAAARTKMFTPSALLVALCSADRARLRWLAGGTDAGHGRHRDMRTTIGWSYRLLEPASQRGFRRLAVFPGTFDLDAATRVCAGGRDGLDVLDTVTELVDLHLVEPVDSPSGPRFAMLDLLREFAGEQLAGDDEDASARDSLLGWCLEFCECASAGLDSAEERLWLERVELELPTLLAVLADLVRGQDAARAMRIASALGPFWAHRGPMDEGRRWFATILALDAERPQLDARARSAAVAWRHRLAFDEGELTLDGLEAARDVLAGDPDAVVEWLRATEHLAYGLTLRGELVSADVLMEEGIERAAAHRLTYWSCVFLGRRALSALRHGDRELAARYAHDAIHAARDIGYERVIARAEHVLAMAHTDELGADGVRVALLANLRAHRAAGDLRGVVSDLASLGAVSADAPTAAGWYRDGLAAARTIRYWHGEASCVLGMAALLAETGRMREAARLHGALAPHLSALRAGIPPDYYAGYEPLVDAMRAALGSQYNEVVAELRGDWPAARTHAAALAVALAGPAVSAAAPLRRQPGGSALSPRELEVLAAIARGRSNPQIAAELHLSAKTVMHHSASVYRKLGVRGRAEAVAHAYRSGLLPA